MAFKPVKLKVINSILALLDINDIAKWISATDISIDGGFANSTYLPEQSADGGGA